MESCPDSDSTSSRPRIPSVPTRSTACLPHARTSREKQEITEGAWSALGSLLNEVVGGADEDLDNAACTCFLENVAVPDHPLRSHLQGEALAFWERWEGGYHPDGEFLEMIRADQDFRRLALSKPLQDLVGVVGAGGLSGSTTKGDPPPRLVFEFSHWRETEGPVSAQEVRCEMLSSDAEVKEQISRFAPYQILGIKAQLANHPQGDLRALVREITGVVKGDEELETLAAKQQEPVVRDHPRFGALTLDRRIDAYCGRVPWMGRDVNLSLDAERAEDLDAALGVAETLWANAEEWQSRACDCAVNRLLDLKNGTWLEEDEAALDAPTFAKRMIIETICVAPTGEVEFWFNDGDLFWGHMIQVSGSLSEGLTDADICG